VVEPVTVVKVEVPEVTTPERAEVVIAELPPLSVEEPPAPEDMPVAPPMPKMVVEPMVDPPEVKANVVIAELVGELAEEEPPVADDEATVVVVVAVVVTDAPDAAAQYCWP